MQDRGKRLTIVCLAERSDEIEHAHGSFIVNAKLRSVNADLHSLDWNIHLFALAG
jgi:hypothetical protein